MPQLKIFKNGEVTLVNFEGEKLLDDILFDSGFSTPHPCGGRGVCGKCAVKIIGEISDMTPVEIKAGTRLSCQTKVLGNAEVTLPENGTVRQIETGFNEIIGNLKPMNGKIGAAIDIGTTTVAVKLYDLTDGKCIATCAKLNPQTEIAADVMGRIDSAINGRLEHLCMLINNCVSELIDSTPYVPDCAVITGNTTMLYLLTERSPLCLSRAPFLADTLFGNQTEILGINTYLPPCMNAFVGADITCAVLASGMCKSDEISLLCDIGTNGEMALWKGDRLYVTSTAAGPAFEGAGISCGTGSISGAIDKVWLEGDDIKIHTIADAPAVGICGSGLLDAVAVGLKRGDIEETGAMDDKLRLAENVSLQPRDIRAVQLAKAAIAAGIETMLSEADVKLSEVNKLYIAGGFGSHLNVESAAYIGLIPNELADKTEILGNAALAGCAMVLLNEDEKAELERIASVSRHVNLGGNPKFNDSYVNNMFFGEEL